MVSTKVHKPLSLIFYVFSLWIIFWIVHFLVCFKNWVTKSTDSLFTFNLYLIEVNPTAFLCPAKPYHCRTSRNLADLTGYFKNIEKRKHMFSWYLHHWFHNNRVLQIRKTRKIYVWQLRIFGCFPTATLLTKEIAVMGGDGLETKAKKSNETGTAKRQQTHILATACKERRGVDDRKLNIMGQQSSMIRTNQWK